MATVLLASRQLLGLGAYVRLPVSVPAMCVIPNRGKSKQPNKTKKEKKDSMRDIVKRIELEKQIIEATINVARKGEPMDPEMLNPARKRPPVELTEEQKEERVLMMKQWTRYRMAEHKKDLKCLQGIMNSRQKALHELKKVSIPLYEQALEPRTDLFPLEWVGPTATPPIPGYKPPEMPGKYDK